MRGKNKRRNLMKIKIKIKGITPLICNRFHDEAAMQASAGTRAAAAAGSRGTPQEICEKKLYLNAKGKPMIPQPNLLRCIVEGGRFHKAGKKQITTQKESLLYACLDIDGTEIDIKHKQPWKVDTRPVVIPSTGGRILAHRPMFDDWELSFTADVDTALVTEDLIRQIIDDAGKRVGLGDYRPARKGPYGKFVVTEWKATK
jgi:hypothetical protein